MYSFLDSSVSASGKKVFRASLSGYEQVPAVSTPAWGSLTARLSSDEQILEYELSYSELLGFPKYVFIKFGNPGTNGGTIVYLCTNLGGFPAQSCPPEGTVTGTLSVSDVIGPSTQGIDPGEFDDFVAALRAGATYVTVQTGSFTAGEIRGQIE
jgi:hypothetical protein